MDVKRVLDIPLAPSLAAGFSVGRAKDQIAYQVDWINLLQTANYFSIQWSSLGTMADPQGQQKPSRAGAEGGCSSSAFTAPPGTTEIPLHLTVLQRLRRSVIVESELESEHITVTSFSLAQFQDTKGRGVNSWVCYQFNRESQKTFTKRLLMQFLFTLYIFASKKPFKSKPD